MGLFLPDAGCGPRLAGGKVTWTENRDGMEKPAHQRAEHPDFWNARFQSGCTPWHDGSIHPDLPRHLPSLLRHFRAEETALPWQGLRVLIPGCGHAHEALYFAQLGAQVVALDFSSEAVAAARKILQDWNGELCHADFFTYAPQERFDFIYERAFLCAMPRRRWPDYVQQAASLLTSTGCLAGFFFYGEEGKGPPFAAAPQTLEDLFLPCFTCMDDQPAQHPLPLFPGERWQVWQHKAR
jgi:thiopurine S-methyltransferase